MLTSTCHCGAVTLEVERLPRKLTQCNCSICRRYGAIWAYYRRKHVRVAAEPAALARYSWGDDRIQFYHCTRCGCVTHHERAEKLDDGSDTLAINVRNAADPAPIAQLPIALLDGAGSWEVLEERPHPGLFG